MNRKISASILSTALLLAITLPASAARVVRVRTNGRVTRTRVVVHHGFPITRVLPDVVVRNNVSVRVAPRTYLAPVVFRPTTVVLPATRQNWTAAERLDRADGWTDLTLDVDRRGSELLFEVDRGAARISFAEVVFENGETQVVDFNDGAHGRGVYPLLDFRNGRKVDHVRVVATAQSRETEIRLHLLS